MSPTSPLSNSKAEGPLPPPHKHGYTAELEEPPLSHLTCLTHVAPAHPYKGQGKLVWKGRMDPQTVQSCSHLGGEEGNHGSCSGCRANCTTGGGVARMTTGCEGRRLPRQSPWFCASPKSLHHDSFSLGKKWEYAVRRAFVGQ